MAGCATSSTTSSAWCARRCASARCCCAWRRTSSGRCASCCRITPGCARPGCFASGLFALRPPGRPRDPAGDRGGRSDRRRDRPAAEAAVPPGLRVFRLLGRRCAPRGAQRARRGRARRGDPHAHALRRAPTRQDDGWRLVLECARPARRGDRARAGQRHRPVGRPRSARRCCDVPTPAQVRLVKGSHIVVRRLFDHDRAYIFQNADGRIIFAIPYEQDFTLIGTTDQDFRGDPGRRRRSRRRSTYLCRAASASISASR